MEISTLKSLMLVAVMLISARGDNFVDFTYSEYGHLDEVRYPERLRGQLKPIQFNPNEFEMPQGCELIKKLNQNLDDVIDDNPWNPDDHIKTLKEKFIQLLKLSERIKKLKNSILSFRRQDTTQLVSKELNIDLDKLKAFEDELNRLNAQIQLLSAKLDNLVGGSSQREEGSYYTAVSLRYEIDALQQKLTLLQNLKLRSDNWDDGIPQGALKDEFGKMGSTFSEELSLFQNINDILSKQNEIKHLRELIESLKHKIKASRFRIGEKQICAQEWEKIRNQQKDIHHIKTLMHTLRQKKLQMGMGGTTSKYCEGIEKNLQTEIKSLLKIYNYTFNCASDLELLKKHIIEDQNRLADYQMRLKRISENEDYEKTKTLVTEKEREINRTFQSIIKLRLSDYKMNADELDALISQTKHEKNMKQLDLENLPSSPNAPNNQPQIERLIAELKQLKAKYCHEHEQYQALIDKINPIMDRYELKVHETKEINRHLTNSINELRDKETRFLQLRKEILAEMKSQ